MSQTHNGATGHAAPTASLAPVTTSGQPINHDDADLSYVRKQVLGLISLLTRSGAIKYHDLLAEIARLETVDHSQGARIVAHAWTDPAFKGRLLADGKAACAELGIEIKGYDELQVVENTAGVHHVVVCTQCSCSPAQLVGLNPDWYKGSPYRTRVIQEPRAVLREFGLELPESTAVSVVDTTVHRRCLVIPRRPAGAEGLSETQLAQLVTQESMYGVGEALDPAGA